jgi:cytoskeletal protein CcmA (bactofilin family)
MLDMKDITRSVIGWTKPQMQQVQPSPAAKTPPPERPSPAKSKEPATIGASICFKGDLTGEEDFVIQGKVEGTINLKSNDLTIGVNGRIHANVTAKTIVVEGELKGDLCGLERVVIKPSANVLGNVVAPRVILEDGAKFRGSIEMEPPEPERAAAAAPATSERSATDLKRA